MRIDIRITGNGPVLNGKAPEVVQKHLDRAIASATMLLLHEVKKRTPQGAHGAQGGLLGSIQGQVQGRGTPAVRGVVGTAHKYGEVVERGRRPGKGMPPEGSLLRWLEVKLGLDARTARRVEYVVRRKIGQKGFEGAHMFEQALDDNWPTIERIFHQAGFSLVRELAT